VFILSRPFQASPTFESKAVSLPVAVILAGYLLVRHTRTEGSQLTAFDLKLECLFLASLFQGSKARSLPLELATLRYSQSL
jgi:hypothetical protein